MMQMPSQIHLQAMLVDSFGRPINYLRWAVTDRCNLRCTYCMPNENMVFSPRSELLSLEEMTSLIEVFEELGIEKIRITGGEPFMRKDIMKFIERIAESKHIKSWFITTNGVLMEPFIPQLKALGISGVNLSLDTLEADQFLKLTKRNDFHKVWSALESMLKNNIKVKINTVIQKGVNDRELVAMAQLAKTYPVDVRFIEFMPFNGGQFNSSDFLSEETMINEISKNIDLVPRERMHGDTSRQFDSPGYLGTIGTIAAFTRNFCGSCNRLRIDAKGQLRNCLYGQSKDEIKALIRAGARKESIAKVIKTQINQKPKDGFAAEQTALKSSEISESMSTIGG